jgi:hypothetical protein
MGSKRPETPDDRGAPSGKRATAAVDSISASPATQVTPEPETRIHESPTAIAGPSKRGPGRPKGLGKVPGSGRKSSATNWSAPETRAKLLPKAAMLCDAVLSGKPVKNGKVWNYPTVAEQLRAAEMVLARTLPTLQAQEITGKDGKDLHPVPEAVDNRDLARAILSVLREAQTEGPPDTPASLPAKPPPAPVEQETIIGEFHDPALAVKFGAIPLTELAVNESETFDNGARVTREIIPTGRVLADDPKQITRYCVYDRRDELIGKKRTFAEAAELAKRLA